MIRSPEKQAHLSANNAKSIPQFTASVNRPARMGSCCSGPAPGNAQCAKYGHTKGTRIGEQRTPAPNASDAAYCYCDAIYPEYACGRCGEVWGTSAGIVERQTHEKLYYHFATACAKAGTAKTATPTAGNKRTKKLPRRGSFLLP